MSIALLSHPQYAPMRSIPLLSEVQSLAKNEKSEAIYMLADVCRMLEMPQMQDQLQGTSIRQIASVKKFLAENG